MPKYMVIEWFSKVDGGLWQIIGFFNTLDEIKEILKYRRKGSKQKILSVSVVESL